MPRPTDTAFALEAFRLDILNAIRYAVEEMRRIAAEDAEKLRQVERRRWRRRLARWLRSRVWPGRGRRQSGGI
jgi:hypothetical protein